MSNKNPPISGVNLPTVPAEPEVIKAFNRHRELATKDLNAEVDCTLEIERLLTEGLAKLDTLR